jgi:hypothetical protein
MRAIKFRVFVKSHNQMLSPVDIANDIQSESHDGNKILMQFTGLCDKNGKDIYEGDILKDGTDMQFPIAVDATHGYRFMFGLDTLVAYNAISGSVIGNIYENPELLK